MIPYSIISKFLDSCNTFVLDCISSVLELISSEGANIADRIQSISQISSCLEIVNEIYMAIVEFCISINQEEINLVSISLRNYFILIGKIGLAVLLFGKNFITPRIGFLFGLLNWHFLLWIIWKYYVYLLHTVDKITIKVRQESIKNKMYFLNLILTGAKICNIFIWVGFLSDILITHWDSVQPILLLFVYTTFYTIHKPIVMLLEHFAPYDVEAWGMTYDLAATLPILLIFVPAVTFYILIIMYETSLIHTIQQIFVLLTGQRIIEALGLVNVRALLFGGVNTPGAEGHDEYKFELYPTSLMQQYAYSPYLLQEIDRKYELNKIKHGVGHIRMALSGPPGTGKTDLGKYLSAKYQIPSIAISASELSTLYIGAGARNLKELFDNAIKLPRALIVIDEIDQWFPSLDSSRDLSLGARNALLSFLTDKKYHSISLLLTTNLDELYYPENLVRPGRLDMKYYLGPIKHTDPHYKEIIKIFTHKVKQYKDSIPFYRAQTFARFRERNYRRLTIFDKIKIFILSRITNMSKIKIIRSIYWNYLRKVMNWCKRIDKRKLPVDNLLSSLLFHQEYIYPAHGWAMIEKLINNYPNMIKKKYRSLSYVKTSHIYWKLNREIVSLLSGSTIQPMKSIATTEKVALHELGHAIFTTYRYRKTTRKNSPTLNFRYITIFPTQGALGHNAFTHWIRKGDISHVSRQHIENRIRCTLGGYTLLSLLGSYNENQTGDTGEGKFILPGSDLNTVYEQLYLLIGIYSKWDISMQQTLFKMDDLKYMRWDKGDADTIKRRNDVFNRLLSLYKLQTKEIVIREKKLMLYTFYHLMMVGTLSFDALYRITKEYWELENTPLLLAQRLRSLRVKYRHTMSIRTQGRVYPRAKPYIHTEDHY